MIIEKELKAYDKNLLEFCKSHKYIILYGTGVYASVYYHFLKKFIDNLYGFCVTQKNGSDIYCQMPVYEISKLPFAAQECGIILSLKKEWHEEVIFTLDKYGYRHYYMSNADFIKQKTGCEKYLLQEQISFLNEKYPLEPYDSKKMYHEILIIRLDAVGDFILTSSFIHQIRDVYPLSRITLVLRKAVYSLAEFCPYVDEIITYDCPLYGYGNVDENLQHSKNFVMKNLINRKFDLVLLPRTEFDICGELFIAIFSGAKVRIIHSKKSVRTNRNLNAGYERLASLIIEHEQPKHEIERIMDMLKGMNKKIVKGHLEIWLTQKDEKFAEHYFSQHDLINRNVIAVVPKASIEARSWDVDKLIETMKRILKKYDNIKFLLLGGKGDIQVGSRICKKIDNINVINCIGKTTLRQVCAVIKKCRLYVGMNTGLLHMAVAFDIPIVEICAHSSKSYLLPEYINSYGFIASQFRYKAWTNNSIIIQPKQGLESCGGVCKNKDIAHCIQQITIEEVEAAIDTMLSQEHKS